MYQVKYHYGKIIAKAAIITSCSATCDDAQRACAVMVKDKCDVLEIGFKAGKEPDSGIIKTAKEKLVLEAFKALGVA